VQPIKDLSEDPKPKASIVVGNVTRHEGFEGIEDRHHGSRHGASLRSQCNAFDRALILLVRQREVVCTGIRFAEKIDDGRQRLDFGSGIKPARVRLSALE